MPKLRFMIVLLFVLFLLSPVNAVSESKVNINTATSETLQTLPGIGPAIAERIIEYREEFAFETIEDIMNVSGIGQATFDKIKDNIAVE